MKRKWTQQQQSYIVVTKGQRALYLLLLSMLILSKSTICYASVGGEQISGTSFASANSNGGARRSLWTV